jgi:hypothetical protein
MLKLFWQLVVERNRKPSSPIIHWLLFEFFDAKTMTWRIAINRTFKLTGFVACCYKPQLINKAEVMPSSFKQFVCTKCQSIWMNHIACKL